MRETIGSGSKAKVLDFTYDDAGKPFALTYKDGTATPKTYYYILNQQGDVVKLLKREETIEDGETHVSFPEVANYIYNAWGEILYVQDAGENEITSSSNIAIINPLRYRGYYYDTETGFYYLQSRYYDPVNHRFINADSYAATNPIDSISYNMFSYCGNNPVNRADPTGHFWEEIWEFIEMVANEYPVLAYAGCVGATAADGPIPVGDIVGGLAATVITIDLIDSSLNGAYDVYYSAKHGGGNFSTSMAGSTPATPPNGNKNNKKGSKQSQKAKSSDKPSWVNQSDVRLNETPQENATRLLNAKYGPDKWPKGPNTEFNKIVKWIQRSVFYYTK